MLPVLPLLDHHLRAAHLEWLKLDKNAQRHGGWLINYHGRPIKDVHRSWTTMLERLDLPSGREWMPYVLRHSLATIVRNHGAAKWDLEGFMGHRGVSQTEVYAIGEFATVEAALQRIIDEIETLVPGALHRRGTGVGLPVLLPKETKMSG